MLKKQAKPGLIVAAAIAVLVGLALILSVVSSVYLKASFRYCDPLTDIYCLPDDDISDYDLPMPSIDWSDGMDPSPWSFDENPFGTAAVIPPVEPTVTPYYGNPNYDYHDSPATSLHEVESTEWITPIDS